MIRNSSRMQRLEEKRNLKRAVLFICGIVVILVLVLTLGFSALTNMFLFISSLKSGGNLNTKSDNIPPSPPQLIVPFEATNSASLTIKGIAEPSSKVYLSHNGKDTIDTTTPDSGVFIFERIKLVDGKNTFSAISIDPAGNKSQNSELQVITLSTKSPTLSLDSPSDRQVVTGKDIRLEVKGTTDIGTRVTVNDRVVIVGADGRFTMTIGLNSGENVLVVVATDVAGNQTRKEVTVTYNN